MADHRIFWHNEDYRYRYHEKAFGIPLHLHQHMEFVYVFSGTIELIVANKTYILHKGDSALVFPWQLHGYFGDHDNNIFICVFAEKLLPELYNTTKNNTTLNNQFTPDSIVVSMVENVIHSENVTVYDIKALLYNVTGQFLKVTTLTEKQSDSVAVDKIITYALNNISSDLDLETVANGLGYSRNYLSHIIKSSIGINFRSLLNCIKFEIAKNLLTNTDLTMSQIAHDSGFGTERSFNRSFKELAGITPKEYRNR